MTEGTEREPHTRRYTPNAISKQSLTVYVNDHGIVEISEELLDQLLTQTGYTETTE